jgi:hypothetical protein
MIDLVSYGGFVIETDNLIEGLLNPYYSELDEIDLSIVYKKGKSVLGISKVYYSNEESNKYIMYMNNVYWSTNSNVDDLLDLIQ